MPKIEDLSGIPGTFIGEKRQHPDRKFRNRALATGEVIYTRELDGDTKEVSIKVRDVSVKRETSGHGRLYLRVERGPRGHRDKIIALLDK